MPVFMLALLQCCHHNVLGQFSVVYSTEHGIMDACVCVCMHARRMHLCAHVSVCVCMCE